MRDVLAKGCALDLHHTMFRPGSSAQTTVGLAGVVLLANDDPGEFTLLVRQSFANCLADWLIDAAEEFRPVSCDAWRASEAEKNRRAALAPHIIAEQEVFYRGRELIVPTH